MKKLKISFFLILVVAFFATSQSNAQVVHDQWIFDITCEDGLWVFCLEEPVTAYIVYNVHTKFDKDGNVKNWHCNIKGGKLIGCNTGTVYKSMNAGNEVIKVNKNNDQAGYHYVERLMFVGDKGKKYIMTWKFNFTVNANGEQVTAFAEVVDCD